MFLLVEKLVVPQLVENFSSFYNTRRFVMVSTKSSNLFLSRVRCIIFPNPPMLFCKIPFNTANLSMQRLRNFSFRQGFPGRSVCSFLHPHTYQLLLLRPILIFIIKFSSDLYFFSLLGRNILLVTLFSKTLILRCPTT